MVWAFFSKNTFHSCYVKWCSENRFHCERSNVFYLVYPASPSEFTKLRCIVSQTHERRKHKGHLKQRRQTAPGESKKMHSYARMAKNKLQAVIVVWLRLSGGDETFIFFHLWTYPKLPTMKILMQDRKNSL